MTAPVNLTTVPCAYAIRRHLTAEPADQAVTALCGIRLIVDHTDVASRLMADRLPCGDCHVVAYQRLTADHARLRAFETTVRTAGRYTPGVDPDEKAIHIAAVVQGALSGLDAARKGGSRA